MHVIFGNLIEILYSEMENFFTVADAIKKLEHFCAYQERCHKEVVQKLREMRMTSEEIDVVVVHLIGQNFMNEERFACSFARGKHRIKGWGRIRIVNELKFRDISKYNIDNALKQISADEYFATFEKIAESQWHNISEKNTLKKRKKVCDYLLRKGFESDMVYAKIKELELKK